MMYVKELAPKEWTLRFWLHWPLSSLREWGMNGSSGMEDRKDGFMIGRTTSLILSQDFLFSC